MMSKKIPTYEELEARLAEAESALNAIRNEQIDALVGKKGVYLLRLRELEDALSKSEARIQEKELTLNALMACVPEGITIAVSPDLRVTRVSRYGKQLLAKSSEELEDITVDQHVERWEIYEPDGKTVPTPESLPLTRAVRKGEIVKNEEWVLAGADGNQIPIICNAAPIRNGSGKITGGIVAWRDISERKQLEESLSQSNQELTEYAYALTHNLKAPFRAIENYAGFLIEDLKDTLDGEPKQFLDGIKNAAIQANHQFRDLEALYHIRNYSIEDEQFEMIGLLNEMQTIVNENSNRKLIYAPQWPVLSCCRFLLRQVLLDLIHNGFKYNQSEIKIVEVGWHRTANNRFEIFVRDNGIGIDPNYHAQIFKIFRRLHTDGEYEGTGIGLSIASRAAQMIGGTLRVESALGKGSTFYINLPTSIIENGEITNH